MSSLKADRTTQAEGEYGFLGYFRIPACDQCDSPLLFARWDDDGFAIPGVIRLTEGCGYSHWDGPGLHALPKDMNLDCPFCGFEMEVIHTQTYAEVRCASGAAWRVSRTQGCTHCQGSTPNYLPESAP